MNQDNNNNNSTNDQFHEFIVKRINEKYPSVLEEFTEPPPNREGMDMEINTFGDSVPKPRFYQPPRALRDKVQVALKELVEKGFIRPSNSPFSSPIVCALKPDGSRRLCCDFQALNAITVRDLYPLPRINEMLIETGGVHYMSKIDLKWGFWQLRIKTGHEYKTSFHTPVGCFEWLVIPFGLSNAPSFFQRFMDRIFQQEIAAKRVLVYIDDLLIMTKFDSEEKHKCSFGKKSIQFLGHIVGSNTIKPMHSKVESIKNWKQPSSLKEVQSFIGLVNYYREIIHNLSVEMIPLFELIKKHNSIVTDNKKNRGKANPFFWTEECDKAFNKIKSLISDESLLYIPDQNKKYYVETDSSHLGAGHVIYQLKDDDGKNFELSNRLVIGYGSKKLDPAQINYTTLEKELFAVFHALKTYRYILLGSDIVVRTDHKNLLFIKNSLLNSTNPRISRWLQEISIYNPKISYIEGQYNYISDGLSRFTFLVKTSGQRNSNIIEAIKDSYKILELGKLPEHFHHAKFDKDSGLWIQNELVVVPDDPIPCQLIINEAHKMGHYSANTVLEMINRNYLIPGIRAKVNDWISQCRSCKEGNYHPYKPFGLTEPLPVPKFSFEVISINPITKLPSIVFENREVDSVLLIIDNLTKFVRLVPITEKISAQENTPDKNQNFFTISSNGLAESHVKITKTILRKLLEDEFHDHMYSMGYNPNEQFTTEFVKENWPQLHSINSIRINNSQHDSIGTTPLKILLGHHPYTPLSLVDYEVFPSNIQSVKERIEPKRVVLANHHKFTIAETVFVRNNAIKSESTDFKDNTVMETVHMENVKTFPHLNFKLGDDSLNEDDEEKDDDYGDKPDESLEVEPPYYNTIGGCKPNKLSPTKNNIRGRNLIDEPLESNSLGGNSTLKPVSDRQLEMHTMFMNLWVTLQKGDLVMLSIKNL
eukprot:gene939-1187_t